MHSTPFKPWIENAERAIGCPRGAGARGPIVELQIFTVSGIHFSIVRISCFGYGQKNDKEDFAMVVSRVSAESQLTLPKEFAGKLVSIYNSPERKT